MLHLVFSVRYAGAPYVRYTLPNNITISLLPKGDVAAFLFLGNVFERKEFTLVGKFIKPGMHIIDVGANVGLYSIYSEKLASPNITIHAFEPAAQTFELLHKNITLNDCRHIYPHRVALTNKKEGTAALACEPGHGDAYRYLAPEENSAFTQKTAGTEIVPITSLDHWAEKHTLQKVDFIKVDIEGGEYAFFEGAKNVLTQNRDVVLFFENEAAWCKRQNLTQEHCFHFLRALGFTVYAWDKKNKSWVEENSKRSSYGMFWACRTKDLLPQP